MELTLARAIVQDGQIAGLRACIPKEMRCTLFPEKMLVEQVGERSIWRKPVVFYAENPYPYSKAISSYSGETFVDVILDPQDGFSFVLESSHLITG